MAFTLEYSLSRNWDKLESKPDDKSESKILRED